MSESCLSLRACVRLCVRVRACVCACMRVCFCACACVYITVRVLQRVRVRVYRG